MALTQVAGGMIAPSTTLTTPTINTITSASGSALTLQSNGGTTAVTVDTSQNVGIGTSSPATKLQVAIGNVSTLGQVSNAGLAITGAGTNNNYAQIGLGYAGTYQPVSIGSITTTQTGYTIASLVFATRSANTDTAPSERMRLNSDGNLLVNFTSFTGNFAGAPGKVSINFGSGEYGLRIFNSTGGAANPVQFSNSTGGEVGTINTNNTNTAYNTSSDYRLKENIAPMTGALATVAQLKPVTYKWKVDGSDGQGFIAHELQEVVPDCVTGAKDAVDSDGNPVYQGIDTSFLVATLTAAIQELKAINDSLVARIEALEAK